jgi:hypothetical protein
MLAMVCASFRYLFYDALSVGARLVGRFFHRIEKKNDARRCPFPLSVSAEEKLATKQTITVFCHKKVVISSYNKDNVF